MKKSKKKVKKINGRKVLIIILLIIIVLVVIKMLNKKDTVQTSPSIKIEDSEAPQLILNGNQKTIVVIGNEYKEEGATATDNIDGDISSEIKISGDLDTSKKEHMKLNILYKISLEIFQKLQKKL